MTPRQEKQKRFYYFLQDRAKSGENFVASDVAEATGWRGTTPRTNLGKQVKDFVQSSGGTYTVKREFLGVTLENFLALVTQKESGLPTYKKVSYEHVVSYEFLLPLTKEDELRRALDGLFYKDTLKARLEQVPPFVLHSCIPLFEHEDEEQYLIRACELISTMFGGYSIQHVSGRFKCSDLMTQLEAVRERYIIDETTAVVRFIIPCDCSRFDHGERFDATHIADVDQEMLDFEVRRIRLLFFEIFVESVVQHVLEEDEIWLLEIAASRQRLYVWEKV